MHHISNLSLQKQEYNVQQSSHKSPNKTEAFLSFHVLTRPGKIIQKTGDKTEMTISFSKSNSLMIASLSSDGLPVSV